MKKHHSHSGFTLIELSIVLVIIGLVIGGVLFGRDLIRAAELRALLSQKDKFTLATSIFKEKYGQLPGDMSPAKAAQFGFFEFTGANAGALYNGDNNGLFFGGTEYGCARECGAYWRHLSDAGLIPTLGATLNPDTVYSNGNGLAGVPVGEEWSNDKQSLYMPKAKLGSGYWAVSILGGSEHFVAMANIDLKRNVFNFVQPYVWGGISNPPSMSGVDAYGMDLKIDDGKPNSGKFMVSVFSDEPSPWFWSDGTVDYFTDTLSPDSEVCTIGIDARDAETVYNADPSKGGNNKSCLPVFIW